MDRYERNWAYISQDSQEVLRSSTVLFAGVGLNSVVAETAMRTGFESQILVDYDVVELTNLNRQNFNMGQIGMAKSVAVRERLLSVNPGCNVAAVTQHLSMNNLKELLESEIAVVVNALDYQDDMPFILDEACMKLGIPVVHPINLGWASSVFVVLAERGICLDEYVGGKRGADAVAVLVEKTVAEASRCDARHDLAWLDEAIELVLATPDSSVPQLAVGSAFVAAQVTTLLFDLLTRPNAVQPLGFMYYASARFKV